MRQVAGIIAALALAATAVAGCGGGSAPTTSTAGPSTAEVGTQTSAPAPDGTAAACDTVTTPTTEGPYYVTGTAALVDGDLNVDDLPGDPIRITGHVYRGAGTGAPLAGAVVDVWQADAQGDYWPESNGPASGYSADALSLRGHVVTGADGGYAFTTISPGEYEGRARHIHLRATSADGTGDVITQIIMSKPGDGTPAEVDAIARSLPECHTMRFTTIEGLPTATFDVHM